MSTTLLWRPLDTANIRDPYAMYERIRNESPVYHAQTGEWIVTGYDDVKAVLKDSRVAVGNRLDWIKRGIEHLNQQDVNFQAIARAMDTFLLFINPPRHTRIRKFLTSVWNDREVEATIHSSISEALTRLNAKQFDVVADYAHHVPGLTMTNILGIPREDYRQLRQMAQQISKALDLYITAADLVTIHTGAKEFVYYIREIIQNNQFSPTGLLNKIREANRLAEDPLTEDELISLFIFLFSAGEETSASIIGTGTLNLLQAGVGHSIPFPHDWTTAMDELLRYDAPVQLLGRLTLEEMEIHGQVVPKGSTLTLSLGAANRDPSVFQNPNELDLARKQNRHVAFGAGIHFCMGDWLGKLQGKMSIQRLFENFPALRLEGENYQWTRNLAIRSLSTLPVTTK